MSYMMKNVQAYNQRMSKSLIDKLFFIPRVDSEVYVDFGCADGTLLGFMKDNFPEHTYVGFETSDVQLEIAHDKFPDITFTKNWDEILDCIRNKNATLILSSVIHEVYSYCIDEEIFEFWNRVFSSGFKHIVIRDMSISENYINEIIDLETVANIRRNVEHKQYLREFEVKWGKISIGINYLHWLLKYTYHENWATEVAENYLPLSTEKLLEQIPETYKIDYLSTFTLPWTRSKALETFGVDLKIPSHIKMIATLK
jgi:SAM-dependent methyltransferase